MICDNCNCNIEDSEYVNSNGDGYWCEECACCWECREIIRGMKHEQKR